MSSHLPVRVVHLLLIAQSFLAFTAHADGPFDWMDVRRKGPVAIAELARARTGAQPWQRVFAADVPAGHPFAGIKIAVARAFNGHAQLQVRVVAGPAEILGNGVVMDGMKSAVRSAGIKAVPLPHEALFRVEPVLNIPWILFASLEWAPAYTPTMEGEFGQVAVLRLTPRYELGLTARGTKVSVSKVNGLVVAATVNDPKGAKMGEVDWQLFDAAGIPGAFGLRGPGDNPPTVRFVAEGPAVKPAKNAFSISALR